MIMNFAPNNVNYIFHQGKANEKNILVQFYKAVYGKPCTWRQVKYCVIDNTCRNYPEIWVPMIVLFLVLANCLIYQRVSAVYKSMAYDHEKNQKKFENNRRKSYPSYTHLSNNNDKEPMKSKLYHEEIHLTIPWKDTHL